MLDLNQVVDAGAEVADAVGLDGLRMAAVAAAPGVHSPSLYSHVDGLSGLRRDGPGGCPSPRIGACHYH